ncbi:hypothetical protein [Pseudomaricurvus sp.]|uniref:hypothetical protein n=1 Tax=Pseudomaricurvus sp. TaxID=2004510 RepID=UPI003F6C5187
MTLIAKPLRKAVLVSVCLCPVAVLADLKPDVLDCDPKKAARNAAMDAGIGVSGKCDAKKVAEDAKDDAKDRLDDKKDHIDDKKDDMQDKMDHSKDHYDKKKFKD